MDLTNLSIGDCFGVIVFSLLGFVARCSSPIVPAYQLTFLASYNTTSGSVSRSCGEHYAETFLENFIKIQEHNITQQCLDSYYSEVTIVNSAKFVYAETKVDIEVVLKVRSRDDVTAHQALVLNCSEAITVSLQHLPIYHPVFHQSTRIVNEDPTKCNVTVTMNPQHVILKNGEWKCPNNYSFIEEQMTCIPVQNTTFSTASTTQNPSIWSLPPENDISTTEARQTDDIFNDGAWGIKSSYFEKSIHLVEGQEAFDLPVEVWANHSALCRDMTTSCHVTLDLSISSSSGSWPVCRRTGQYIPQVVIGQVAQVAVSTNPCSIEVDGHLSRNFSLKGVSDNKYDGQQHTMLNIALTRTGTSVRGQNSTLRKTFFQLPVIIEDQDRKATCQSINDPHIATFDGLEYNNYYEGEFVLYKHATLPFKVHAVYQKCTAETLASCNCAVAVQSGDDVLVIDRCRREKQHIRRFKGIEQNFSKMTVQLYMNNELTPGTKIYSDGNGKKYFVYLPLGTVVKVLVSGTLVNVWVIASPADRSQTQGLCGRYNGDHDDEMHFPNGTVYHESRQENTTRPQPVPFILSWRVDINSPESLLNGVPASDVPYASQPFCLCEDSFASQPVCDYGMDVNYCDNIQGHVLCVTVCAGEDITEQLVSGAVLSHNHHRSKKDLHQNPAPLYSQPIIINKNFVPGKHKFKNNWNEATAKDYCERNIRDEYSVGQLCSQLNAVNFKREFVTCLEDIQITGNVSWLDSARDAMKEQCLEEVQRNSSLNESIAKQITGAICINDCSGHGQCVQGQCHCEARYSSADCSVDDDKPPYLAELPEYGLCDVRTQDCSSVVVHGANFVNSPYLQCHFQEVQVSDDEYQPKSAIITVKGRYRNFNSVECHIPAMRSYLISISNNGSEQSDPLLFVTFDSACDSCNLTNMACTRKENSCIIDNTCFREGETSPSDECLVCKAFKDGNQWSSRQDGECLLLRKNFALPDWAVALFAALAGSLVGVVAGFLLYKCCCKSKKLHSPSVANDHGVSDMNTSPFEDAMLHRNRGLPPFSSGRFTDIHMPQPQYPDGFCYSDGQGVENGVDSTTYF